MISIQKANDYNLKKKYKHSKNYFFYNKKLIFL